MDEDKIREALEGYVELARSIGESESEEEAREALEALSSPHPEAREEERVISHFHTVRDALESFDDPDCTRFIRIAKRDQALVSIDQLCLDYRNYRLAAPKPQTDTQNLIKHLQANLEAANNTSQEYEAWGKDLYIVIDDLRAAIDEWGCKHDHPEIMHEIDAANKLADAIKHESRNISNGQK